MPNYVAVKFRDTGEWKITGCTKSRKRDRYIGTRKRGYYSTFDNWIIPEPEAVSCFVEKHIIIEAESEEHAWRILNSKLEREK